MIETISSVLPYKVLFSHVLLVLLFVAVLLRRGMGKEIFQFLGRHVLALAFLVSLGAALGSLFYSEIIGFEPCVLCWWQRVFLYPLVPMFGIAALKHDKGVFRYALPLILMALIVALYQSYANMGWGSILPCTAAEGACSRIYVKAFGYITIPVMSLTIALYLLLLAWVNKLFKNENSNAR